MKCKSCSAKVIVGERKGYLAETVNVKMERIIEKAKEEI